MKLGLSQRASRIEICSEEVIGVIKLGRVIKRLMFLMAFVMIFFIPSALVYINFDRLLRNIFRWTHSNVDLFGLQLPWCHCYKLNNFYAFYSSIIKFIYSYLFVHQSWSKWMKIFLWWFKTRIILKTSCYYLVFLFKKSKLFSFTH